MNKLIATLYDHECLAGMSLNTAKVKTVKYNPKQNKQQFADDLADRCNVQHGHVSIININNMNLALCKITVNR